MNTASLRWLAGIAPFQNYSNYAGSIRITSGPSCCSLEVASKGGGDRSEVGGRTGLGRGRTNEVDLEVENER